ncbi:hypothetical protein MUK71_16100 [Arthrobacter zhangbolii]|uniref:Uncharacterized protein n=1 Tax=Arthrobacter zhangbolii TaxID=2886936 RepID=A0A9X1M600_9MICC|nr:MULTISPECIES: hypothetical protein [Arthrobacter]MCC3272049.1 hypothetical protein [Arthrobacter zhangbolii]MDN3903109.1 hypothetical protein [Arthrobacter sp. YD2]UON92076.1 hypothetical protein MUK71_16100 [Arthrobacter zhangbolii]
MPEYPLPSTAMPETSFTSTSHAGLLPEPRAVTLPAEHPPVRHHPLKEVYSMLKRLHSSYLRSSAVHDARLDAALRGEQGHLLLHYFHSAK